MIVLAFRRTIKPIGPDSLPARGPISINHDASIAVYARSEGYEVWRVNDSAKIGTIARGRPAFAGLRRPQTTFVGKGNVVAISDGGTPWAIGPNYQRLFNEVTSRGKYPVSVYGRVRNGKMQFRGRFFDKPEKLDFITHHGITEELLRQKDLQYRARGFQEFWRHTFVDHSGTTRFSVIWNWHSDERRGRGRNRRFGPPGTFRPDKPK